MHEHPSPEFEKELRETLRAPNANPAFVHDLRTTLLERSKMKGQTHTFYRLAWGLVAAVLLIGLLAASPGVVEALKQLLGYIPGVGYMEQGNSLRMLTAPVMSEKDGLTLMIQKGAADSQHTVLLGRIEAYFTPDRNNERSCDTPTRLLLPDGRILALMQSETSMTGQKGSPDGSYYVRYVFEAMPAGQMEATLEVPCLLDDANFRDWKLALQFEMADEANVMPVIELPTASSQNISPQTDTVTDPLESTIEGFSIVLESESRLSDGYILSGSYQWTDPRFEVFSLQIIDPEIIDANGQSVPFAPVEPAIAMDLALKKLPFAYQIDGKNYAWPLTISINTVTVSLPDEALFQFDAGADPQMGQRWDVNIDVPVGEHIVHVQTIELTAGRMPTELGFTFIMTSDPEVMGASIHDTNPMGNSNSGGGGGGGGDNATAVDPFTYGWALEGYSPAGVKTFVVSNVAIMFHGNWQVTWQPTAQ